MVKKSICAMLVLLLIFMTALPAAAYNSADESTPIVLHFRSDIGGLTSADYEKFVDIKCDTVAFNTVYTTEPVGVADYGGTHEFGEIRAGRTYSVHYSFVPVNGYVLPEKLDETQITVTCGKGVQILSCDVTVDPLIHNDTDDRTILVTAVVKADGDFMQRFFGRIYDIYLKIRAWSLY